MGADLYHIPAYFESENAKSYREKMRQSNCFACFRVATRRRNHGKLRQKGESLPNKKHAK